jgi:hypothetical protein
MQSHYKFLNGWLILTLHGPSMLSRLMRLIFYLDGQHLYLPRLTHISLGNTNRDAALVSGQKPESHFFQQTPHSPYSPGLALSDFALFEWKKSLRWQAI